MDAAIVATPTAMGPPGDATQARMLVLEARERKLEQQEAGAAERERRRAAAQRELEAQHEECARRAEEVERERTRLQGWNVSLCAPFCAKTIQHRLWTNYCRQYVFLCEPV